MVLTGHIPVRVSPGNPLPAHPLKHKNAAPPGFLFGPAFLFLPLISSYALTATGPAIRSRTSSCPRANNSSIGSFPASTSARIAFCARYSLFTMPAFDCSIRHALRRSTQNITSCRVSA